ncbi:hypothetical protein EDD85DRAFT_798702 [Armillaria nabsnona]|nr:hypothetical protein EDD85DRAFT_798702 [Armillaria nabsnona]
MKQVESQEVAEALRRNGVPSVNGEEKAHGLLFKGIGESEDMAVNILLSEFPCSVPTGPENLLVNIGEFRPFIVWPCGVEYVFRMSGLGLFDWDPLSCRDKGVQGVGVVGVTVRLRPGVLGGGEPLLMTNSREGDSAGSGTGTQYPGVSSWHVQCPSWEVGWYRVGFLFLVLNGLVPLDDGGVFRVWGNGLVVSWELGPRVGGSSGVEVQQTLLGPGVAFLGIVFGSWSGWGSYAPSWKVSMVLPVYTEKEFYEKGGEIVGVQFIRLWCCLFYGVHRKR